MPTLSNEAARSLPIFKVWADDGKHPSVALNKSVCVIGRREVGVNLPLQAPEVSKLHALVVRTHGRVYVRDLASRNGVQRNGAPVQEVGLSDEDVLRIGSYTLRCLSGFGHAEEGDISPADAPPEPVAPAAELVGPDGATYPFPRGRQTLLIGHREGCEVRLEEDENVAPVHAILFEIDGRHFVRDLGAPSGTFLNHQPTHQSPLKPGDEIRVGGVTLRYALIDANDDDVEDEEDLAADDEAAAVRDALGVNDSAPGIDLGDSATNASNIGISDSVLGPEISIEDSRNPGASTPGREPSAISEYDFDVVDADADPRRESTFAGEVVGAGTNALTPDDAKATPAELPAPPPPSASPPSPPEPIADASAAAASSALRMDDSAIPIAGSFHDRLVDDDLLKKLPEAAAAPSPALAPVHPPADTSAGDAGDAGDAPIKVVASDAPGEARAAGVANAPAQANANAEAAKADAAEAADAAAADEAMAEVEQEITRLVEEVTERVGQVSEKVELVAAKVERVAAKMTEVTKDVSEVAETAGALQEVWSEFRGGDANGHPGTQEKAGDRGPAAAAAAADKSRPDRDADRATPRKDAEKQGDAR